MTEFIHTYPFLIGIISCLLAAAGMPLVIRIARQKHLVVRPNKRMSHDGEIPNIGGIDICFSFMLTYLVFAFNEFQESQFLLIGVFAIMCVGLVDDILILSPGAKLLGETLAGTALIGFADFRLTHFFGIFGVNELGLLPSYLISLFILIAIINAINLIDGVDGLCSGFCVLACSIFFGIFAAGGAWCWAILALVSAAASIPFLLHNVFGKESHIYFGDSGTLMMGTLLSCFVIEVLRSASLSANLRVLYPGICLVAMVMAVLAEPVMDCLRVMGWRMAKGLSAFKPDRTHLHHLFTDARFSHPVTALAIHSMDLLIVAFWFISYLLGASKNLQFFVVVVSSVVIFGGFYFWMSQGRKKNSRNYRRFVWLGIHSHFKRTGFWQTMRTLMDRM